MARIMQLGSVCVSASLRAVGDRMRLGVHRLRTVHLASRDFLFFSPFVHLLLSSGSLSLEKELLASDIFISFSPKNTLLNGQFESNLLRVPDAPFRGPPRSGLPPAPSTKGPAAG